MFSDRKYEYSPHFPGIGNRVKKKKKRSMVRFLLKLMFTIREIKQLRNS
jgi:hypothetical protein